MILLLCSDRFMLSFACTCLIVVTACIMFEVVLITSFIRQFSVVFESGFLVFIGLAEFQFPVQLVKVPSGSRLSVEGVRLLIHGLQFCLTAHVPPRILHSWNVTDLRRFGTVDGKFCFEGGSRCGKGQKYL